MPRKREIPVMNKDLMETKVFKCGKCWFLGLTLIGRESDGQAPSFGEVFSSPLLMSEACRSKVCFAQYLELFKDYCVVAIKQVSPSTAALT